MQVITPSKSRSTLAAHNHPETDERGTSDRSRYREINPSIREQFESFRDASGNTNVTLGKKLGYPDGTAVSKYISNKYDRDPADIEDRIVDLLKNESRRRAQGGSIFATSVINQADSFFDSVQRTNTVGVFHSPAGLGKSTAIVAYLEKHPTAVLLTANAAQNDATGIRQLFWGSVNHRGYCNGQARWDYLVEKFAGSGRLIIVDNAQRIASTGRDFLFDFRDATGCPIVLVGNPAILQRVAQNDQQFSRTVKEHEAVLRDPAKITKQIIDAHMDDGDLIYDLAFPIVKRPGKGHLRSLVMTLTSMTEFLDHPDFHGDPRKAFLAALSTSIHHKH